jgi:hypothetical protein
LRTYSRENKLTTVQVVRSTYHLYSREFIFTWIGAQKNFIHFMRYYNFDVKRTCTTGKCRDPTNTKGDVEGHRVCDKHIIRWRSHHPQWPWWTFQQAGYCPSSSWSRRTNPKIWESDTTLTAYLPPSGCRIVQRNRCPPNHPVVGTSSSSG